MTKVAFQGELGAYSEDAVHSFFAGGVRLVPQRDFAAVGRCLARRAAEFGLLPIENTLAGSVVGSYDVLASGEFTIVGEVITPIHHCVLGIPGATADELTRVHSHPVALAQCLRYLHQRPAVEAVAVYDTAGAALEVASKGDRTLGAIASRRAAERYGLDVLAADVEDRPDNQTRFLVVRCAGETAPPPAAATEHRGPPKTAFVVETKNEPGALVRILLPFAARGINLAKLECRPAGEPWTYRFFIEIGADAASAPAAEALAELDRHGARLTMLGTFPCWMPRGR